MKIGRFNIHSPNRNVHKVTMNMLEEGKGPLADMETSTSFSCEDPECNDVHSTVEIETVADYEAARIKMKLDAAAAV